MVFVVRVCDCVPVMLVLEGCDSCQLTAERKEKGAAREFLPSKEMRHHHHPPPWLLAEPRKVFSLLGSEPTLDWTTVFQKDRVPVKGKIGHTPYTYQFFTHARLHTHTHTHA